MFGAAGEYGFLKVVSTLSWGLGYFGVPQVLLRFMAIRKSGELKVPPDCDGMGHYFPQRGGIPGSGRPVIYPTELLTSSTAENIFIVISTNLLPPLIAGIAMAGILAATISSSDSYLLIAASAVSKNIFQGFSRRMPRINRSWSFRASRFWWLRPSESSLRWMKTA